MRAVLAAVLLLALACPDAAAQVVAGRVFEDLDADGLADGAEVGVANLPVALFGNGVDVPGTTDATGAFVLPASAGCRGVFIDFPAEPDPATGSTGGAWRPVEADSRTCPATGSDPVGRLRWGTARHLRARLAEPSLGFIQLGDSIAAGVSVCIFDDTDYAPEVAAELDCLGASPVALDNRAVAGWHSEDLLTRMDGSSPNPQFIPNVVAAAPDLVTISIGGNDFLNTEPGASGQSRPFPAAALQASLQELVHARRTVQEILSTLVSELPGSEVVINSVYDNQADSCATTDFHAAAPPIWNQMLRHAAWGQVRPVRVAEVEPEFAHQDLLRGSCCGAEDRICAFDGIHPTEEGADIIQHAVMESLGRVQVPAAGVPGFDVGALRLVAVLQPSAVTVVQGDVVAPDATLALDGTGAVASPGATLDLSGFTLPDGVVPVRIVVGVRYRTSGAFADDDVLFDASVADFAPPQWTFTGWDTSTPIVGGSGTGGNIANTSQVNALRGVPAWRDVSAMLTLNAVDDGTAYSWPSPTADDVARLKVRLRVQPRGTPDAAGVAWDGAWAWVYGSASTVAAPPGEVSGPGDGPLLLHRDRGIVLDWAPEALAGTYRVWRGDIGTWDGAVAQPGVAGGCVDAPATTWTEVLPPDQHANWYFLVSAVNAAGDGPVGFDSFGDGTVTATAACP